VKRNTDDPSLQYEAALSDVFKDYFHGMFLTFEYTLSIGDVACGRLGKFTYSSERCVQQLSGRLEGIGSSRRPFSGQCAKVFFWEGVAELMPLATHNCASSIAPFHEMITGYSRKQESFP